MTSSNNFLFTVVQVFLILPLLSQAQDQSGFISIDCGISGISRYTDTTTDISYVSDASFVESGENHDIATEKKRDGDAQQLSNLRSFPEGTRNCYTLKPKQGRGSKYLIRARFMYGNYDGKRQAPTFDLYLGANLWTKVMAWDSSIQLNMEIIHIPVSDHIEVCLVNTGNGIPFISALELRPIGNEIYLSEAGTALQLGGRYQFSSTSNSQLTRYNEDIYDRLWATQKAETSITTDLSSSGLWSKGDFEIPIPVMSTAYTGDGSNNSLNINFLELNKTTRYFFYMHFAELERLESNQTREFYIYVNDDLWYVNPVQPFHLSTTTMRSGSAGNIPDSDGKLRLWLNNTDSATLPPLINAIEVYVLTELPQKETNQTDVDAISNIKSVYGLEKIDWQGDPCTPAIYRWGGLNCSYNDNSLPRIVSLTLSSSGLKGEIAPSMANLTMLRHLDLSNNNLTGTVPEFLAHLPFLKVLNLKGNSFTGQVPEALLLKKDLELRLDTNLSNSTPCSSSSCRRKKSFLVPLVSVLGGVFLVMLIAMVVIWSLKRRRQQRATDVRVETASSVPKAEDEAFGSKQQEFTYLDIQTITNNFQRVLGEGGFGKVYHGLFNGNEVAVKILSSQSIQGHREFHAELKLLLMVHHKNLTTLVGYCNEGTNVGLIYEYMAMGNLRSHISGSARTLLSWEDRLRIAIDAAQGLEYLHDGCKPPIIHRDVKSTNILLNDKFQAKLGDFGLAKIFPVEGGNNHITASIAGTPGYLDPEYYKTNWLNEKSDVYSFGVVLLEMITARPVLMRTRENSHIIEWVSSMIATGDIRNIVDPRLGEDCDINSVWKIIEIAMTCISKTSSSRPTMSRVTTELKECLTSELSRKDTRDMSDLSKDSSAEMMSQNMVSEFSPAAR